MCVGAFPCVWVSLGCQRFGGGLLLVIAVRAWGRVSGITFAARGAAFGAGCAAVGAGAIAPTAPFPCDDLTRAATLGAFGWFGCRWWI